MKKAIVLLVTIIMVFSTCACGTNNSEKNVSNESDDKISESAVLFDNGAYEEEIQKLLKDWGNVRWDSVEEYYVISPRGTYLEIIKYLAKDPTDAKTLGYWDEISDMIAEISRVYNCAICVANPANNTRMLLVTGYGDILTSVW